MNSSKKFSFAQLFQIIILASLLNFSLSFLSFKYPHALKLNNDNIFIIHQLGTTVCNENFTEIIEDTLIFSEEDRIDSDEELSKVEAVLGGGHIISLIHDKIHIFNGNGQQMRVSDEPVTDLAVEYYSLVYLGKDSNIIKFLVGFINNHKLYLKYYQYEIWELTLTKKHEYEKENSYTISSNALSCHNMNISYTYFSWGNKIGYKDIITCIYSSNNQYYMNLDFFKIESDQIKIADDRKSKLFMLHGEETDPVYIKGDLFEENMKLTYGWLTREGIPYYRQYDIEEDKFAKEAKFFSLTYCKLINHGFQIKYFPEKKEVMYTCIFKST